MEALLCILHYMNKEHMTKCFAKYLNISSASLVRWLLNCAYLFAAQTQVRKEEGCIVLKLCPPHVAVFYQTCLLEVDRYFLF